MSAVDVAALAAELAPLLAAEMRPREPFYTPRTLAERLGVSERTVRDMVARGVIESLKIEGARRISPEAVDAYLARCAEGAQAA